MMIEVERDWRLQIYVDVDGNHFTDVHEHGHVEPNGKLCKSYPITDPFDQGTIADPFVATLNKKTPRPKPKNVEWPNDLAGFEKY